ncbi:MAG: helix-turn-helix transcriptional regulator [Planctomycetales bacterium]|nr:helix-turn-helix transcriptional regulator [bacterium]UNM09188.1 MAG: helix-turn-helix transcriptional regulator [Planctomycetales bacterium]
MLELAALGALLREPMHGYALREWLEHYMGTALSANFGAIYPLLKRLTERGLVRKSGSGGRRTVYEITEAGRAYWLELMTEEANDSWVNAQARFMTRMWFSDRLDPAQRRQLIQQRVDALRERMNYSFDKATQPMQQSMRGYVMRKLALELEWLEGLLAETDAQLESESNGAHDE